MRRPLVAQFALLGAAGGWLTADAFGLGRNELDGFHGGHQHAVLSDRETRLRIALVVATTVLSALVGWWSSSRRVRGSMPGFIAVTLACGIANGVFVGEFAFYPEGAMARAIGGAIVSALFLPFLLPVYVAARTAKARDGSILAGIEHRTIWSATFLAVAVATILVSREPMPGPSGALAVIQGVDLGLIVGAFAASALLAAADGVALRRSGELAARSLAPRSSREPDRVVDLGIGDAQWEDADGVAGPATYRHPERVARAYAGDARRAFRAVRTRFVLSLLVAASTAAGFLSFASRMPRAPRLALLPLSSRRAPASAPAPRIRPLYSQDWRGTATLAGVDRPGERAFVTLEAHDPPGYALDVIDLANGARLEHWEAPAEVAYPRAHWVSREPPPAPTPAMLDDERAHAVAFVRQLDPRPTAWFGLDPVLALSPDGASLVWNEAPKDGHDGDFLFLGDTSGAHGKRLGAGERASYAPVFSPDGSHLTWHGCGTPCSTGYHLYIADVHGDLRGDRIDAVAYPKEPVWSVDGQWVYAVSHPNGVRDPAPSCVWRVAAARPHDATRLSCSTELQDVTFAQDPTGATGLLSGTIGAAPSLTSVLRWIALPSGRLEHALTIESGARFFVLDPSGLALSGDAITDLSTGERAPFEDVRESKRWISPYGAAWIRDGLAVALRSHLGGFEIVSIDARGALQDARRATTESRGPL
jgi:hypothetical protein